MSAADGPAILFVDFDGTVRHGRDELGHFVNRPEDVVIFPEAVVRMRAWRAAGGVVCGVTNQAGVAAGYMSEDVHEQVMAQTVHLADGQIDHAVACVHAESAACWCRKPRAGLLYRGAQWFGWPPRRLCLMIGDRPEDVGAAAAAGVRFLDAAAWRAGTWPDGDGAGGAS